MTRRNHVTAVLLAGRHYNAHGKLLLVSVHFFFFETKLLLFMMMFNSEEKKHPRNRTTSQHDKSSNFSIMWPGLSGDFLSPGHMILLSDVSVQVERIGKTIQMISR